MRKVLANYLGHLRTNEVCYHCEGLAELRKKRGFKTAKSFAFVVDIPYGSYTNIEAGKFTPNAERQQIIAATLGVNAEDIFGHFVHSSEPGNVKVSKINKPLLELQLRLKFGEKLQAATGSKRKKTASVGADTVQ